MLTRKYIWNKKSREKRPKNKKFVTTLQSCPLYTIRWKLKYRENGETTSSAQAAVVRNAAVR